MYSFIKPRKKIVFDSFTYLWIAFILLTSVGLIGFGLYIDRENRVFKDNLVEFQQNIQQLKDDIERKKSDIIEYKLANSKNQETILANKSLENGIKNIFLLIPNQIEISKLLLKKYDIKIYGKTNSPKTYKLLLEPPLKSIFDSSRVGFTKVNDDEYLFTSHNKIKRDKNAKK